MAFFGLTALGPQNTFATAARNYRYIQVFSDEDFEHAWKKVNKDSTHCHRSKIASIMKVLFHGPTPENEIPYLDRAFSDAFALDDMISMIDFIKLMCEIRRNAEADQRAIEDSTNPVCEYTSTSELQQALKKNAAVKTNVQQKLTVPITGTQEVSNAIDR